jgi:hypothetical protein
MPRNEASVGPVTQQWFVEQLGNQIVEEEHKLRPDSGAVPGYPV